MSFVAAAASVGTWAGLSGTAAVIGGGAMIGAGVGGAYSALTGDGNILDSMLTGATIGGLGGWGLGAAGVGGAATGTAGATGAAGGAGALGTAGEAAAAANTPAVAAYGGGQGVSPVVAQMASGEGAASAAGATNPSWWGSLSGKEKLGYGLGATTLLGLLGGQPKGVGVQGEKGDIRPYEFERTRAEPPAGQSAYFKPIEYDMYGRTTAPIDTSEKTYFTDKYTPLPTYKAAMGGEVPPHLENMAPGGLAALQGARSGYSPMTTQQGDIPQFAIGGMLGGYSDGGQLLKGPGDGVSDSIPASINQKQPARLADGEFVVPARIVSELGNGSTDAGAKRLYEMMDRVQSSRKKTIGKGKVAVDSKAKKYLPA